MKRIFILAVALWGAAVYNVYSQTPQNYVEDASCDLRMKMVYVEGRPSRYGDDKKAINSFYIAETELTQYQWMQIMGGESSGQEDLSHPKSGMAYEEALAFCKKLSLMTGRNYRLPTEDEWWYAFSGGNKSKRYYYSGSHKRRLVAWFKRNSGWSTHSVGVKMPNELGLYDMSGNVAEMCLGARTTRKKDSYSYRYSDVKYEECIKAMGGDCRSYPWDLNDSDTYSVKGSWLCGFRVVCIP